DSSGSSSGDTSYPSPADKETIDLLKNTVSQLTKELAEQRERQKKAEKATTSQIRKLQQQFSSFIQTAGVIPPCPGDAVRAAKGLGPLDEFSTDEDMEEEHEFDDACC
ncbi:uncharacterized protein LOC124893822, partial [Capsicum annuum]|uniref:uncharacterized protein LOC124893822 n=1 Tax=Capsicum annuum TaxID=4072 RepID=UPI001FB0BC60